MFFYNKEVSTDLHYSLPEISENMIKVCEMEINSEKQKATSSGNCEKNERLEQSVKYKEFSTKGTKTIKKQFIRVKARTTNIR